MATERFLKLPQEKKKRIIDAAIEEISRANINDISINKIVKNAGIPRGSFYDYFEDKNDLISFIMQDYKNIMIERIKKSCDANGGDIFQLMTDALNTTVEFGLSELNYRFCRNVFSSLHVNSEHSFEIIRINIDPDCNVFFPTLDTSNLKFSSTEDVKNLVEILSCVLRNTIVNIFVDAENKDTYIRSFNRKMQMIKEGCVKAPVHK